MQCNACIDFSHNTSVVITTHRRHMEITHLLFDWPCMSCTEKYLLVPFETSFFRSFLWIHKPLFHETPHRNRAVSHNTPSAFVQCLPCAFEITKSLRSFFRRSSCLFIECYLWALRFDSHYVYVNKYFLYSFVTTHTFYRMRTCLFTKSRQNQLQIHSASSSASQSPSCSYTPAPRKYSGSVLHLQLTD